LKDKKVLATTAVTFAGILMIIWGLLHGLIMITIREELIASNVDKNIISLVTLSYLGIMVMISVNGLVVIYVAMKGIKSGEKWAYFISISQGFLYSFVSVLLITLQPKVSVLNFPAEVILALAIFTDLAISVLILGPLIIWRKEFL
jgi:hypothetical protein